MHLPINRRIKQLFQYAALTTGKMTLESSTTLWTVRLGWWWCCWSHLVSSHPFLLVCYKVPFFFFFFWATHCCIAYVFLILLCLETLHRNDPTQIALALEFFLLLISESFAGAEDLITVGENVICDWDLWTRCHFAILERASGPILMRYIN